LFTAGLTKIAGALTHSVNLYTADEDPQASTGGDHNGRAFSGAAYSLLYRLNGQHTPYLRASYRNDKTKSVTLGWFWQVARNFMLTGEAAYTDNSSNITLFDYSRFRLQAGLRYHF
jgi:hypothetical protein